MSNPTKKYTYHKYHEYVDIESNEKVTCLTQQYYVGVYGIINNDPGLQFSWTPQNMVSTEKKLKKSEKDGKIRDLKFDFPITVQLIDNLWETI